MLSISNMKTDRIKISLPFIICACISLSLQAGDKLQNNGQEDIVVFPVPREIQINQGRFCFDNETCILLPEKTGISDNFPASLIVNDLADKYMYPVKIIGKSRIPETGKHIIIGDLKNPHVRTFCENKKMIRSLEELGDEGYILYVDNNTILVAANSTPGTFHGVGSLKQIINKTEDSIWIPQLVIKDAPEYPFRGIKLYLPGRENIQFFKRFIREFVSVYKFNTIILELNANMRLDRHPELNIGTVEFERYLRYERLDRPPGLHQEFQNSSHQDNADGQILDKDEVADIVNYVRKFNIEVIPELPSLTHSYYLLFGHRDLAENTNQPWPDTYCPLKPEIYTIYFDVLDEYIDVIHPSIIHAGHDEWRMEKDVCELCRGKDYGELFAKDLTRIHDYLAQKGIKTAIWGDHLLESVRGTGYRIWKTSTGYKYKIPAALRPEQVLRSIPKDILIFNWFWNDIRNDKQISDFGFKQVYGNLTPDIKEWSERHTIPGLLGGAPSSWAATTEFNIGKDQIYDFLGCADLLWSGKSMAGDKLGLLVNSRIEGINSGLNGAIPPSHEGNIIAPLDISSYFNASLSAYIDGINNSELISGIITSGNKKFSLNPFPQKNKNVLIVNPPAGNNEPSEFPCIKVNEDANSIIFLHASTDKGYNKKAFSTIHNFEETAELLGWYEVKFEDGLTVPIPLRYGVNILDCQWYKRLRSFENPGNDTYAYKASPLICSKNKNADPIVFFTYEWKNPRPGIMIKEIILKSVEYRKNNKNSIMLLAISIL